MLFVIILSLNVRQRTRNFGCESQPVIEVFRQSKRHTEVIFDGKNSDSEMNQVMMSGFAKFF